MDKGFKLSILIYGDLLGRIKCAENIAKIILGSWEEALRRTAFSYREALDLDRDLIVWLEIHRDLGERGKLGRFKRRKVWKTLKEEAKLLIATVPHMKDLPTEIVDEFTLILWAFEENLVKKYFSPLATAINIKGRDDFITFVKYQLEISKPIMLEEIPSDVMKEIKEKLGISGAPAGI